MPADTKQILSAGVNRERHVLLPCSYCSAATFSKLSTACITYE
jgi:hypothetical protein